METQQCLLFVLLIYTYIRVKDVINIENVATEAEYYVVCNIGKGNPVTGPGGPIE